jgi:hypothetical protein
VTAAPDYRARIADAERRERAVARSIVDAVVGANAAALAMALSEAELHGGVSRAISMLGQLPSVCSASRDVFLAQWLLQGDRLSREAGDDLALVRALRVVLPPYEGPGLRLWRGELALNQRHGTYGLSWTSHRQRAQAFAYGHRDEAVGGMVLIEAKVGPNAIIAALALPGPTKGELEYLVDRRQLNDVRAVEWFRPPHR